MWLQIASNSDELEKASVSRGAGWALPILLRELGINGVVYGQPSKSPVSRDVVSPGIAGVADVTSVMGPDCKDNRGPAFTGDVTIMTADVVDKLVDDKGRHLIQVDCKMANQLGTTMATAKAEIELPKK